MRNQQMIDLPVLYNALQNIVPSNVVIYICGGLLINEVAITIREGIASFNTMKFRFIDLKDLLDNLVLEGILNAKKGDLYLIKRTYFELINKKDNGKN